MHNYQPVLIIIMVHIHWVGRLSSIDIDEVPLIQSLPRLDKE